MVFGLLVPQSTFLGDSNKKHLTVDTPTLGCCAEFGAVVSGSLSLENSVAD
jgi:hypothetical protein